MKSRTKWILGLGCLPILGCGGCVLGFFGIVFGALSSSEPCKLTIAELNNDPFATELLGSPIEGGWLVTGQVNIRGNNGDAEISIPVSGPKGSGTADVRASKVNGQWVIESLALTAAGQRHLMIGSDDLPGEPPPELPAEAPEQKSAPLENTVPNDKLPVNDVDESDPVIQSAN